MTQFFPPISAITRLTWSCPAGVSAAAADDLEPDRARTRERDQVDSRVADQRRARVALAREQPERRRGDPGPVQRLDQRVRAPGRLLRRLQHDRVARRERRGGHPGGDREREVPGRDHRGDAERLVADRVALPGRLGERRRLIERRGAGRVVLEEVDRLADVGVGLRPRLRALAHLERRQLEAALAQGRGRIGQHPRALGAAVRAPVGEPDDRGVDGRLGVLAPRRGRRPRRPARARPGRSTAGPAPRTGSPPISHRDLERQPRGRAPPAPRAGGRGRPTRRSSSVGSFAKLTAARAALRRGAPRGGRAGRSRWRCSRAGGGPGRPSRRPGRRPGSRSEPGARRARSASASSSPSPRRTWSSRSASSPPESRL